MVIEGGMRVYKTFSLVLAVTQRCNLVCRYCYNGAARACDLPLAYGQQAINRALSLVQRGGELHLGSFGGEPLLCVDTVIALLAHARFKARAAGVRLACALTTNGMVQSRKVRTLLAQPEVQASVSCDGLPVVHDRHRVDAQGRGSSRTVLEFIATLTRLKRAFSVTMVVRPDTVSALADGVRFLHEHGVRDFVPTLDLWTRWSPADIVRLEAQVHAVADLWHRWLPEVRVSWFDEKLLAISGLPRSDCSRCAFGDGEIAVAPSGWLYPCERLIGEDRPDNPHRPPGHIADGGAGRTR